MPLSPNVVVQLVGTPKPHLIIILDKQLIEAGFVTNVTVVNTPTRLSKQVAKSVSQDPTRMKSPARTVKNVPLDVSTNHLPVRILIQFTPVLRTALPVLLERAAEKEQAVATTVLLEHSPTPPSRVRNAQVDGKESQKEKEKIERRNVLLASKVSTKVKMDNRFASHATLVRINLNQDNNNAQTVQRIPSQIKEGSQAAKIVTASMKIQSQEKHFVRNVMRESS